MFTTPLRSEYIPPMPAKMSGVEKTNVDAIRSARKTVFKLPALDLVARIPSAIPTKPPPRVPDRKDQDVCADEEHDQALDDVGQVARELRVDLPRLKAVRRAEEKGAEQERREADAHRGVAAEQRDRDAEETDRGH